MSSNRRPEEDSNNNVDDQVKKLLKDGIDSQNLLQA